MALDISKPRDQDWYDRLKAGEFSKPFSHSVFGSMYGSNLDWYEAVPSIIALGFGLNALGGQMAGGGNGPGSAIGTEGSPFAGPPEGLANGGGGGLLGGDVGGYFKNPENWGNIQSLLGGQQQQPDQSSAQLAHEREMQKRMMAGRWRV